MRPRLAFRSLMDQNDLGEQMFEAVRAHLKANGMAMKQGMIVDATIIAAPSSTKNEKRERDPEMHQTCKGKQWHFGMKVCNETPFASQPRAQIMPAGS